MKKTTFNTQHGTFNIQGGLLGNWKFRVGYWIFIFLTIMGTWAYPQLQPYNHPELKWRTIETDHFYVHFHQGAERTAAVTAKIAEEIYEPITSLYEYHPDSKMHFIIRDHDDDSNGAAFYYDNKIELMAPAMDFPLRGTHNWLRNVITHEFSHMISLGAARKLTRSIPAFYMQWLDYEKEKRTDVIHGYPRTLVSFPIAGTVIPIWFAEGMAQFHKSGLHYDTWDSHRDMLLRTAVLGGELLTLPEMAVFGKNSLGNERVYNQGYALTLYIAHQYGEETLRDLVRAMKKPWRMQFSGATQKVLQKSEKALYEEWVDWLREGYMTGSKNILRFPESEQILEGKSLGTFHPVVSPDGKQMAYLSNRRRDYLSHLSLWLMNLDSGKSKKLKSGVTSSVSWSPDGQNLVYAKKTSRTSQGSHYYDLYRFNLKSKKETRITRFKRVREPDWSVNSAKLVCVLEKDGSSNLAVMGLDGNGFKQITHFQNGEQVYSPRWNKDGGRILFALSDTRYGRDIASIDSSGMDFRYEIQTRWDERDPAPGSDGQSILYACDRSGIFNIYRRDIHSGEEEQLTNVLGGAFMPAEDSEQGCIYVSFTADGFKIARTVSSGPVDPRRTQYHGPYEHFSKTQNAFTNPRYDDSDVPKYESSPYKTRYSKIALLPRVMMDYPKKVKVGTYFYGNDYLGKINLLGGFAVNGSMDMDIFGIFEYKKLYPTLFLEAYYQSRHTDYPDADYVFNLMEVDLGADWRLGDKHLLRTAYIYSRYSARMEFEDGQVFKLSYKYHLGNALQAKWTYRAVPSTVVSPMAPTQGRVIIASIERYWQRFLDGFEVHQDYGTLVETYSNYDYNQFFVDWREYLPGLIKNHSLALHVRGGFIDKPVHSFYNFFGGGLDGLKGYPYYSIEGRKLIHMGLAYRLPVSLNMQIRFWFLHFDKLFISIYGQAGEAWSNGGFETTRWKKDVGLQMRLGLVTFYSYPMSVFFDAAYGLHRFTFKEQSYGGELRTYFGLLFDFLD